MAKVPTTTGNQADGVLAALAEAAATPAELKIVVHGTTTATNALLERKGRAPGSSPPAASATSSRSRG